MISKLEIGDLNLEMGEFDIVKVVQNVDLLEMKSIQKRYFTYVYGMNP
jgi:two-component system phosphate regulon sensor histidine kinase PhoR